ncbi:MAG: alpha/beta hydrolase [Gemmatimonadaceae bacterium]
MARSLVVRGVRLHYLEWPRAGVPALVFLSGTGGGGGSAWQWSHVAVSLQQRYRVIAVETRGAGESAWTESYGWSDIVADLDQFANDLGLAPFVLVGHSTGARWAALYAAMHPDKVARLVLVDSDILDPILDADRPMRTFASPDAAFQFAKARWTTDSSLDPVVRRWIDHGIRPTDSGEWTWRIDPRLNASLSALPNGDDLRRTLGRIRCPTLVVRGERSAFTRERAAMVATAIGRARVTEVARSGHVVHLANPSGFSEALESALRP